MLWQSFSHDALYMTTVINYTSITYIKPKIASTKFSYDVIRIVIEVILMIHCNLWQLISLIYKASFSRLNIAK